MDTKEKQNLAEMVIDHALKGGAQQVSVNITESRSNNIEIRDQKIDNLTESNRNSLSIVLYVDKKYSTHSTNRLRKDDLFKFTDEAIAATKFLGEDEFRTLPDPELFYKGGGADSSILDSSIETIEPKTKIELARQVHDEAFGKDDRIISVSSYYSDTIRNRLLVTSNGFSGTNARSDISLSASVAIKSDTGRPEDYWSESAQFFNKLKKENIGKNALDRVLQKFGMKKISSGKYPMLVENRVSRNLLSPFYSALQGSSIYQKQSFLDGKLEKAVGSKVLTIIDDPSIPSGPGSKLFDDEGLASIKRTILEAGVLRNYYIDTYYGKKLKIKPTSGSSSNVIFTLGNRDMTAMLNSLKKGIVVTGFNGGNCNGSTGDFSYGIEGFYVENGKIVHPVNEMNISGNMNDIWFRLAEAGNDIIEGSSYMIPSLLFDKIDFSGV